MPACMFSAQFIAQHGGIGTSNDDPVPFIEFCLMNSSQLFTRCISSKNIVFASEEAESKVNRC